MAIYKIYFSGLLGNVDESILKMNFERGFKIESIDKVDAFERLSNFEGVPHAHILGGDLRRFHSCLRGEKAFFITNEIECDIKEEDDISFVKTTLNGSSRLQKNVYEYLSLVIRIMRLYKEGNICMPMHYYYYIIKEGRPITFMSEGPTPDIQTQLYHLDDSDIPDLMKFIQENKITF